MMYIDFTAGNKDYKLRLTTKDIIALERHLGCNPLAIFGNGDTLPTLTAMVQVLHASLQSMNHGITMSDAYDIFDAWLADGHVMTDFLQIMVDVYKASGLIKSDEADTEKN